MLRQAVCAAMLGMLLSTAHLFGAVRSATAIPATDANIRDGLSLYNWVCKNDSISSAVNGASLTLRFKDTRQVALLVDTSQMTTHTPSRFPIIAWSVNGRPAKSHQLAADEKSIELSSDVANPRIELYIKGMSPFENRFQGDVPGNAVKIMGIFIDRGGAIVNAIPPGKIWLNIGDSIMSGDGAAYAQGQGRPPDDRWAESEDSRASYGYLLAQRCGYRESRIAYGGYDWGGNGGIPALSTLIDQKTSTVSRLMDGKLSPAPDVVLINLGENGTPAEAAVTQAPSKLRSRVNLATKIIVMIPVSGRAKAEVTRAFNHYKNSAKDEHVHLVDLGHVTFATCDGPHPTAAGHEAIYKAASPVFQELLVEAKESTGDKPASK